MLRINPGDSYLSAVLPAVIVFGIGLTLVVAPVTATVLAAVDSSHAGIASGVNNAVARVAGLLAVAVIPTAAGITGDKFYEPSAMTDGFHTGMVDLRGAGAARRGGRLDDDLLRRPPRRTRARRRHPRAPRRRLSAAASARPRCARPHLTPWLMGR